MIKIEIPGWGTILLQHLVSDVNGTLAVDGSLQPGVLELLTELKEFLEIHLITADTHGRQKEIDQILGIKSQRISTGGEAEQ